MAVQLTPAQKEIVEQRRIDAREARIAWLVERGTPRWQAEAFEEADDKARREMGLSEA